ncbi:MAG: hypothetical protein U0169_22260 [Polyangiaceae bacterium]
MRLALVFSPPTPSDRSRRHEPVNVRLLQAFESAGFVVETMPSSLELASDLAAELRRFPRPTSVVVYVDGDVAHQAGSVALRVDDRGLASLDLARLAKVVADAHVPDSVLLLETRREAKGPTAYSATASVEALAREGAALALFVAETRAPSRREPVERPLETGLRTLLESTAVRSGPVGDAFAAGLPAALAALDASRFAHRYPVAVDAEAVHSAPPSVPERISAPPPLPVRPPPPVAVPPAVASVPPIPPPRAFAPPPPAPAVAPPPPAPAFAPPPPAPAVAPLPPVPNFAPPPAPAPVPPASVHESEPPPSEAPPPSERISVIPPSARSGALAAVDSLTREAENARNRGDLEGAVASYKKALMLASQGTPEMRANIYANLGELKLSQGDTRAAENNYEKALAEKPGLDSALIALTLILTTEKAWPRVAHYRRLMVVAAKSDSERVSGLFELAKLFEGPMADLDAAVRAMDEARAAMPNDVAVLARLSELATKAGQWTKVAEVATDTAKASKEPKERAANYFVAADVLLGRVRDEVRGLEFLELALFADPDHEKALFSLEAVRTRRKEWAELARIYNRLVEIAAQRGDGARAGALCKKLGVLLRDRLDDAKGAIDAFTGALKCDDTDLDARMALADLFVSTANDTNAAIELERATEISPFRGAPYKRLVATHTRAGRSDAAWIAAVVALEVGERDMDTDLLVGQWRNDGAARPKSSLDDAAWNEDLRSPGWDPLVATVLAAVGPAAVSAKVAALASSRLLPTLDPTKKQSPESTVSFVRSFAWAADVLGVAMPDLYVSPGAPGGLSAVPMATPTTFVAPELLTNLGLQELAFLAGRHLAYYRPEHAVILHYPTLDDLSLLFMAAASLAMTDPHLPPQTMKLRRSLEKHMGETARETVLRAIRDLERRGGTADLASFLQSVERTANRAGVCLAGDLPAVARRIRSEERGVAGLNADQRRGDVFAFFASRAHGRLRARLGIAARPSVRPPPPGPTGPLVPAAGETRPSATGPAAPPGPPPKPGSSSS